MTRLVPAIAPHSRHFRYWAGNAERGRTKRGRHGIPAWLVLPNTESGLAITTAPERWHATWDNNLRLARIADESGIDFLLPVARWTDWGPDTDFHRSALDPLVWASGLLAQTERIRVFSTVHTAFHHPVVAAKQLATADHLSRGGSA